MVEIIAELNAQKQILVDGAAQAGVMQADLTKYWIPYNSVLALFNGLLDALDEINDRLNTVEAGLANRMLCKKYDPV
jgi:hypothetical protein